MTFSWDRTWGDLVTLCRAHVEILLVLAGVFVFLPAFAIALYLPPTGGPQNGVEALRAMNAYVAANWLPLLLAGVATRMGEATILAVLLNSARQTVSASLSTAVAMLFPFVVLNLITSFAVVAGVIAFVVPGIYLLGRLAVAAPAMMAEREANPLHAIARSIALTRGKGWRIAGLIIFVFAVAYSSTYAVKVAITVLLAVVVPQSARAEAIALVSALLDTVVSVVSVLLVAAIYRQLAARSAT